MPTIKYRELRRRYELDGAKQTVEHLSEALAERQLHAEDFSLRDLAAGSIHARPAASECSKQPTAST